MAFASPVGPTRGAVRRSRTILCIRPSAFGAARDSLTAPLGHSFGVRIDGLAATAYNSAAAAVDLSTICETTATSAAAQANP